MATNPLEVSLSGYPLLLEDPDGKVQQWLDWYLPVDDLRVVTSWQASVWSTWNSPRPNYSPVLRPKVNTWYRPVGASRWSFGLFLADQDTKNSLVSSQGVANSGMELRLGHGNISRSWLAYMLPPRPLAAEVGLDGLWLIPVVDERYYWQFTSVESLYLTDSSTWSDVFDSLSGALGITLRVDSPESAYGSPHVTSFNPGDRSNAAQLLDAAAMSVGRRVVLDYEQIQGADYAAEVYRACSWGSSRSKLSYNLAAIQQGDGALQSGLISGGPLGLQSVTPESIKVSFRFWDNGIIVPNEFYQSTQSATSFVSTGYVSGRSLSINSMALANVTGGLTTPSNQSTLDDLAEQIASDFYQSLGWVSDQSIMGVSAYIETGFDDYVEFSVGRRRSDGTYELRTRAHTAPHNFGVQSMLHQVTGTHEYPDIIEGKLDTSLSAGGTATLSVWEGDPKADSGRNLTVRDRLYWDAPAGSWCVAAKIDREWRPIAVSCDAVP